MKSFAEGAASGIIAGIAIKTGYDVDEVGISITVLKAICQATQSVKLPISCETYVLLLSILSVVVTIATFIDAIKSEDDWRVGLLMYAIGFVIGLGLILVFA